MSVAETLERIGGTADFGTLVRLTSRRAVKCALAAGDVERDARGRLALPTADAAMRRAAAIGGVVSDLSAAALWGWSLKQQPDVPQVTVPKHRRIAGSKSGVRFVDLHADDVSGGVTSRERTLVDCLRRLPFDESLCVADSYLRDGAHPSSLIALARSVRGPGAPRVRKVAALARGEAANAFESVLRALALEAGLDVEPQVWISAEGQRVRPDLVDERRRLVLEADSFAWHGSRSALRRDARRYNWLVRHGWTVLRFAWEDVMHDQGYVLDVLREFSRTEVRTEVTPRRRQVA